MEKRNVVIFGLAGICAIGCLLTWLLEVNSFVGPLLIGFFSFMALGLRNNEKTRGFSFSMLIFAGVTVAMFYPNPFVRFGNFEMKSLIVPLLQIIMFGMGTAMSLNDFQNVIRMPKGVLVGMACQFTIMPFVGFGLAYAFNFPPEIAAGIVLVGSSPSGLASNVMSYISKANLALSVTLTAVATLLAPLMTPVLMKLLAGQLVPINFWAMMASIFKIVIIPIVAGLIFNKVVYAKEGWWVKIAKSQAIIAGIVLAIISVLVKQFLAPVILSSLGENGGGVFVPVAIDLVWILLLAIAGGILFNRFSKGNADLIDKTMPLLSMGGIAIIITIITAAGRDSLMQIGLLLIVACLIHNMAGYFLGYWTCRFLGMDEKSCRTIALEVGMQNGGLASGIALEMGRVATLGLAPAVFGPMMNITGSSLATWWRGKPTEPDQETEEAILEQK